MKEVAKCDAFQRSVLPLSLYDPEKYAEFNIQASPGFINSSYIQYILLWNLYILTILFSKQLRPVLHRGKTDLSKVSTGGKRHCLVFLKPDVKNEIRSHASRPSCCRREAVDIHSSLFFVSIFAASSCRVHIGVRDVGDGEPGNVGGGDGEAGELHDRFGFWGFGDGARWRGVGC